MSFLFLVNEVVFDVHDTKGGSFKKFLTFEALIGSEFVLTLAV